MQHDTFASCGAAADCRQPNPSVCRAVSNLERDPMKIHEYQGKEILRKYGIPVPRGIAAFTLQEAVEAAQKLGGPVWVVKAQIHAGGRGKGGGVRNSRNAAGHPPDRRDGPESAPAADRRRR